MTADQILALARAYAEWTDYSLSTIGTLACGNQKIFNRLADGKGANIISVQRAALWFHENWPRAAKWPDGVPRPKVKSRVA